MSVNIQKLRKKFIGFPIYLKHWIFTFKGGISLLCLLILLLFPALTQNPYYLGIFVLAMIYTIFAASWDFLAGFSGQISFGHAIFFGLSAYGVSAALVFYNLTWWGALLVGVGIAVIAGFLVGIICLRLKGPYLALGTMTIAIMLLDLFKIGALKPYLWGDQGIIDVPPLSSNEIVVYYTVLIFMVMTIIVLIQITKSNMGTIFKSIRDDETGSEASGINTTKYKVIAFMISSAFAGLAGGFFAMYIRSVGPLIFQPLYSFYVLIMAALGGVASISGSALGAFIFIFLSEILRDFNQIDPSNAFLTAFSNPAFIFSIILIIIIRFVSSGLMKPALERLKEFFNILLGR